MKKWYCGVSLSLLALLSGCTEEEAPTELKPRPVQTVVVPEAGAALTRSFSGKATASRQKQMSFKVGGTLLEKRIRVGDRVVKGDVLARIDESSYLLQRDQARAQLTQAEAQARQSRANYERTKGLYREDVVSKSSLDQARAGSESAAAQVTAARNELALADLNVSYTRLVAKETCGVAATSVEVGENVSVGQAIATLECGEGVDVVLDMPESLINAVRNGAAASVSFNAIPDREFAGIISEVGVASIGGGTFPVKIHVENSGDVIRPGLAATVALEFPYQDGGRLAVPVSSVARDSEGDYVFVVAAEDARFGTVNKREVHIGRLTNEGIEVLSGLQPGELLVTAGVNTIYDGLKVRLTNRAEN